ncbi:hypothetical protein JOF56_007449 [Kibdelosporangium banguiense]|uniref:Peptidase inhibitor family I36 n=1 Tax=Kibdelosporangium banguiense TaxID=1365924 RepID=A0ABS4TRL6_9PSEU|nr:peptidase inhibitor family I36 protein [Kibdelosporangium banguiense]MBP2327064.1 hypothetical protein [Kibdelosporangium banguiense]
MLRNSRRILLTVCSIVALVFSSATAATASTSAWSDCWPSYSCMWTGLNGGGSLMMPAHCGTFLERDLPPGFNNNIESIKNQGGGTIRLFDNASATGTPLATYYNNGVNHNLTAAARNKTSSLRIDC